MTLTIPGEIARSVQSVAAGSSSAEQLLLQALQAHFPPISGKLQAEFDAWELASDEDMARLNAEAGADKDRLSLSKMPSTGSSLCWC